jgi:PTH2 family peptidyl-tRNA hydrolase
MKQDIHKAWLREGQKKVAVKVGSQEELIELVRGANSMGLPYALVKDAGLTELTPGTATVVGIGPAKSDEIDRLTGHLKLL